MPKILHSVCRRGHRASGLLVIGLLLLGALAGTHVAHPGDEAGHVDGRYLGHVDGQVRNAVSHRGARHLDADPGQVESACPACVLQLQKRGGHLPSTGAALVVVEVSSGFAAVSRAACSAEAAFPSPRGPPALG